MALRDWIPTDATSATPVGWFDVQTASTLTLDANNTVTEFRSRVGGWKVTPPAVANQVPYSAIGYNSLPALLPTTDSHWLSAPAPSTLPTGSAAGVMSGVAAYLAKRGDYTTLYYWGSANGGKARSISAAGEAVSAGYYGNDLQGNVRWTGFDRLFISAISAAGLAEQWVDGGAVQSAQKAVLSTPATSTFWLGRSINGDVWKNPIQEVILWSGTMSASDRQKLEGYFAWRWNLVSQLPADHPYKTTKPQIDDGATPSIISAAASGTLAGLGTAAAASLAIVGAAALTLGVIGGTQTASAPVTAQGQAPLGSITSSSDSTAPLSAASSATLGGVTGAAASFAPVAATASAPLGPFASASAATAPIRGAASQSLGPLTTVSAARADVTATAASTLAPITGAATGHAETPGGATAASTLSPVGSAASGQVIATGSAAGQLGAITAASAGAVAARGAAISQLGTIGGAAAGSTAIGAVAATPLGSIASAGRGVTLIAATTSVALAPIGGTATGTARGETADHIPSPGWARTVQPRSFTSTVTRRNFYLSSTGSSRMISFPPKYADEVRHASVDFTPDLGDGETLVGAPTVTSSGDVVAESARIDGGKVLFTLRGGSADGRAVQRIAITAQTSHDQTLEEVALLTLLS